MIPTLVKMAIWYNVIFFAFDIAIRTLLKLHDLLSKIYLSLGLPQVREVNLRYSIGSSVWDTGLAPITNGNKWASSMIRINVNSKFAWTQRLFPSYGKERNSWHHQMETFSALLAICAGNSPVPGEFPAQKSVMRSLMFSLICAWINGWLNNREATEPIMTTL